MKIFPKILYHVIKIISYNELLSCVISEWNKREIIAILVLATFNNYFWSALRNNLEKKTFSFHIYFREIHALAAGKNQDTRHRAESFIVSMSSRRDDGEISHKFFHDPDPVRCQGTVCCENSAIWFLAAGCRDPMSHGLLKESFDINTFLHVSISRVTESRRSGILNRTCISPISFH